MSLRPIALNGCIGSMAIRPPYIPTMAGKVPLRSKIRSGLFFGCQSPNPRELFNVSRHGLAIRRAQLRRVSHNLNHGAADKIGIRCHAGRECVGDVLHRPSFQFLLGNVGRPPLAVGTGASRKPLSGFDSPQDISWRMTLSAVPWSIDQIGATIPLRRLRRIGLKWLAVKKQPLPAAKRAADIERERQSVVTN